MKKKHKRNPRARGAGGESSLSAATAPLRHSLKQIAWKKVAITLLWLAILLLIYTVCNHFHLTPHVLLYPLAAGILAVCFFLLNGCSFSTAPIDPDALPRELDAEAREALLARLNRRRETAKRLLPPLIGLVGTLLIDMLYLHLGDFLG